MAKSSFISLNGDDIENLEDVEDINNLDQLIDKVKVIDGDDLNNLDENDVSAIVVTPLKENDIDHLKGFDDLNQLFIQSLVIKQDDVDDLIEISIGKIITVLDDNDFEEPEDTEDTDNLDNAIGQVRVVALADLNKDSADADTYIILSDKQAAAVKTFNITASLDRPPSLSKMRYAQRFMNNFHFKQSCKNPGISKHYLTPLF